MSTRSVRMSVFAGLLSGTVVAGGGCVDAASVASPSPPVTNKGPVVQSEFPDLELGEAELGEIARDVPSYGGHFLGPDGSLYVWVRGAEYRVPAVAAVVHE